MRPSAVREKGTPVCSSSYTAAGASRRRLLGSQPARGKPAGPSFHGSNRAAPELATSLVLRVTRYKSCSIALAASNVSIRVDKPVYAYNGASASR